MSGAEVVSVAELDRRLRRAVEDASGRYWVLGEITSLKQAASGHAYFTLKDDEEEAVIECVMYRFDAQRARRHLVEGARIQLWGRATLWAPRGRLQLVANFARPAGRGSLLEALEALKARLQEEGLFSQERKRPLPADPRIVGVVTSAHGAAFHDVRTVAFRRGGVRLVLAPAVVQGEAAPDSIVRALDLIERYPSIDVVIVGRGGGSGEDLSAYNDERVVRRVAKMAVPVVSAVGHETDVALTDLVADVRAATPSQAAELVVPDRRARSAALARCRAALDRVLRSYFALERSRLARLRAELGDPRFIVVERQQELDELSVRLERRFERDLASRRGELESLRGRLLAEHPRAVLARSRARLGPLHVRLDAAASRHLQRTRGRLAGAATRLDGLSPLAVLGRGYAIATGADGRAVRDARALAPGDAVSVRVLRGSFAARVTEVEPGDGEPR
jgi:exodeoxyribonuclease VII large subunit